MFMSGMLQKCISTLNLLWNRGTILSKHNNKNLWLYFQASCVELIESQTEQESEENRLAQSNLKGFYSTAADWEDKGRWCGYNSSGFQQGLYHSTTLKSQRNCKRNSILQEEGINGDGKQHHLLLKVSQRKTERHMKLHAAQASSVQYAHTGPVGNYHLSSTFKAAAEMTILKVALELISQYYVFTQNFMNFLSIQDGKK